MITSFDYKYSFEIPVQFTMSIHLRHRLLKVQRSLRTHGANKDFSGRNRLESYSEDDEAVSKAYYRRM